MVFQMTLGTEIPESARVHTRYAVRAVIFREERLLMVKTNRGDYKFPGGKREEGETDEEVLSREIDEETGYRGCVVKRLLGEVCEQNRDTFDQKAFFQMTSAYYLCSLSEALPGTQNLDRYEQDQEFTPEWIPVREALERNRVLLKSGAPVNPWVRRETQVLGELAEKTTRVYFVRHAQPRHDWDEERTRPLTEEGILDSRKVTETLKNIPLSRAFCSPYRRSVDTIRECAARHGLEIVTDERLRERMGGSGCNTWELIAKRWSDFYWHEEGGESLEMVQRRNMEALNEILSSSAGRNVLLGTHGTALSVMLNHYAPDYNGDSFFRMIDYMPYIVRLDFLGTDCIGGEELLVVDKPYRFGARQKEDTEKTEKREKPEE